MIAAASSRRIALAATAMLLAVSLAFAALVCGALSRVAAAMRSSST